MPEKSVKKQLSRLIERMSEENAGRVLAYAKTLQPEVAASDNPRKKDVKSRLQKLRQDVQKNPEKWTVDAMAEAFHLTRSRFSVLYKECFGVPPDKEKREFLNQKAKDLLESTSKSVQQVAKECGYNECENFIRAFRKSNGMSPLQFRTQANLF